MPHHVVMRRIEMSSEYRPLSDRSLIVSAEIGAPPTNTGPVYFRGDLGDDVLWPPGSFHFVQNVDVSLLFARGEPGDVVTVIGGTWRS